jgi:hypothetical protein
VLAIRWLVYAAAKKWDACLEIAEGITKPTLAVALNSAFPRCALRVTFTRTRWNR